MEQKSCPYSAYIGIAANYIIQSSVQFRFFSLPKKFDGGDRRKSCLSSLTMCRPPTSLQHGSEHCLNRYLPIYNTRQTSSCISEKCDSQNETSLKKKAVHENFALFFIQGIRIVLGNINEYDTFITQLYMIVNTQINKLNLLQNVNEHSPEGFQALGTNINVKIYKLIYFSQESISKNLVAVFCSNAMLCSVSAKPHGVACLTFIEIAKRNKITVIFQT